MPATVVIPGGEIADALKFGAIDASEWVGPWFDMDLGLIAFMTSARIDRFDRQ